jgi:beta-lactam-binding protein with PASTA domain
MAYSSGIMDDDAFRLYRGPGWFGVVVTSLITSGLVMFGTLWAVQNGYVPAKLLSPAPEAPVASGTPAKAEGLAANVKVPTILGLPADTATELLSARGLRMVVRERRESSLAANTVITQDPLMDSTVPRDSPVAVTVSSGPPDDVEVPDLVGKSLADAQGVLEKAGFALGIITGPDSGDRVVLGSDPAPGAATTPGGTVKLTVGLAGSEVPKLTGMSVAKAKKLLESSGFALGKVRERYDDYADPYVVLQQTPEAGSRAPAGTAIDLIRNEGD